MEICIGEEKKHLLTMKMSLLLQNLENLDKDNLILSENFIQMNDVKPKNTIFNKKNGEFYLIDIDMFHTKREFPKTIYQKNNFLLFILLRAMLSSEIIKLKDISMAMQRDILFFLNSSFLLRDGTAPIQKIEEMAGKEKDLKTYFLSRFN